MSFITAQAAGAQRVPAEGRRSPDPPNLLIDPPPANLLQELSIQEESARLEATRGKILRKIFH